MLLSKVVAAASFLIAMFNAISAIPRPGIVRERHVIHAPIKFRTIHHYKIKKVPIIIKKHIHYYKPQEETRHRLSNDIPEENHSGQIYQENGGDLFNRFKIHQEEDLRKLKIPGTFLQQDDYEETPEDDYEEQQEQSQEEEYKDYEYE